MLSLIVGVIAVGTGVAKLGFVADLLSKPVRVGYLAGLAITIFVSQLPKLFGYSIDSGNVVVDLRVFLANLDQTNVWALGVGLLSLVIILGLKRWLPRWPGILIAVLVAIGVSIVFDLAGHWRRDSSASRLIGQGSRKHHFSLRSSERQNPG